MKATLEFDLDKPEEAEAHIRAVKATKAYLALYDIVNMLHSFSEREEIEVNFETLKNMVYEVIDDNEIHLDEELS
jgi:hypothetical protein